mmetsp:Transcript_6151/g.15170  ORF Transcript_6151/g.15170 Transcript_6151/m.15170 type:complete len:244 (+) Transcript_6151:1330-2061(+)
MPDGAHVHSLPHALDLVASGRREAARLLDKIVNGELRRDDAANMAEASFGAHKEAADPLPPENIRRDRGGGGLFQFWRYHVFVRKLVEVLLRRRVNLAGRSRVVGAPGGHSGHEALADLIGLSGVSPGGGRRGFIGGHLDFLDGRFHGGHLHRLWLHLGLRRRRLVDFGEHHVSRLGGDGCDHRGDDTRDERDGPGALDHGRHVVESGGEHVERDLLGRGVGHLLGEHGCQSVENLKDAVLPE